MDGRGRIGADRNERIRLILAKVWFWFVSEHVTRYCRGGCFTSHKNRKQNKYYISEVVLFCVMICLKMLKRGFVATGCGRTFGLGSIKEPCIDLISLSINYMRL